MQILSLNQCCHFEYAAVVHHLWNSLYSPTRLLENNSYLKYPKWNPNERGTDWTYYVIYTDVAEISNNNYANINIGYTFENFTSSNSSDVLFTLTFIHPLSLWVRVYLKEK